MTDQQLIDEVFRQAERPEPWWMDYRVNLPPVRRGKWEVRAQEIPFYQPAQHPRVAIAAHGRPMPPVWAGRYTALIEHDPDEVPFDDMPPKGTVWMSDSPNEIFEQVRAIRRLRGRVLIGGLGIGVMVKAALARPDVELVEVVELDPDIIAMVAPHYSADPRLRIHHADLMGWEPPAGESWDVAWFDIWPTVSAMNLPDMLRLADRFRRRADWMGFWCDNWCVRKAKEGMAGRPDAQAAIETMCWVKHRLRSYSKGAK